MITYKLLLKEVEQENTWGYQDKDAIKLGKVAFPFKGKTDDYDFDLKKGDEVYYQYGTNAKLNGEDYVLVSLTSLVCQKS
jgi:co-chaperonin GroES (HSP10)